MKTAESGSRDIKRASGARGALRAALTRRPRTPEGCTFPVHAEGREITNPHGVAEKRPWVLTTHNRRADLRVAGAICRSVVGAKGFPSLRDHLRPYLARPPPNKRSEVGRPCHAGVPTTHPALRVSQPAHPGLAHLLFGDPPCRSGGG